MQTQSHQRTLSSSSQDDRLAAKNELQSSSSVASTAILDDEEDSVVEMPLLYYQRQHNDNQYCCTASIMGKVILNQTTSVWTSTSNTKTSPATTDTTTGSLPEVVFPSDVEAPASASSVTSIVPQNAWYNETIYLVVFGYSNGQIGITEATTNSPILDLAGMNNTTLNNSGIDGASVGNSSASESNQTFVSNSWYVTSNKEKASPVVAVSIDASGTVISAIDASGNCTIWTVKYSIQYRHDQSVKSTFNDNRPDPSPQQHPSSKTPAGNIFTKLFWRKDSAAAAGISTSSSTTASPVQSSKLNSHNRIPILTMIDVKVARLQYSSTTYGIPTCLCLDPCFQANYKILVGFTSGKLIVTSRNWMRRFDENTLIPYSGPVLDNDWIGIEAIAWRSIIAFADCSGVKLYDPVTLKPIAHVDRPIGAQPSLYHWRNDSENSTTMSSISSNADGTVAKDAHFAQCLANKNRRIFPHLNFETSQSLLVAWGDCLMTLSITDTPAISATSPVPITNDSTPIPSSIRKRNVACTMAWALDGIVASDIVPIDRRHVAILGHVLLDDGDDHLSRRIVPSPYDMELQLLDRIDGSTLYSDMLQLQQHFAVMGAGTGATGAINTGTGAMGAIGGGTGATNTGTGAMEAIRGGTGATGATAEGTGATGGATTVVGTVGATAPESGTVVQTLINRNFRLLSSFAVPCMDDSCDLKGENNLELSGVEFIDSHLKWDLNMVSFQEESTQGDDDKISSLDICEDDTESVDSDDYRFVVKTKMSETSMNKFVPPPFLVIVSNNDTILARVRDLDDAIQFALDNGKPALALRRALSSRVHRFRKYGVNDLINNYLRSLLRLQSISSTAKESLPASSPVRNLSLRRMTLAAQALPILLGGDVDMWKMWISELERIPGALFLVRKYVPVRDPKLPKTLYSRVISKMLDEVEDMRQSLDVADRLVYEAEGHVLDAVLAWGTTATLQEHIKMFEYQTNLDSSFNVMVRRTIDSLHYRLQQSAAGYLDLDSLPSPEIFCASNPNDSLYSIDDLFIEMAQRASITNFEYADAANLIVKLSTTHRDSRVTIDAIAKLFLMKNSYDEALKCFLVLGAKHSTKNLEDIESDALRFVNDESLGREGFVSPYAFVLYLIENHHLHQCLLEANFLPGVVNSSICALVRLVGLNLVGDFLIDNCTTPQQTSIVTSGTTTVKSGSERRGTLPLDLVAEQLKGTPKLLHWYLHLIVCRRPELYVKFPTTANPPPIIATLHKKHLDLYLRYAGPYRDSAQALTGVEAYLVTEKSTPLLAFLKLILQLGTVSPVEVGKMLEIERRGGAGVSRTFALELAYIMENYGSDSESDALLILELFLKGAQSLMLAASFAQRAKSHGSKLWEKLIEHCLLTSRSDKSGDGGISGVQFGALLEAAALSGADLAFLVAQIPKGMQVEGLRPRLVAAVADYRLKVQLHAKANEMALDEMSMLFQEASRRSRRGVRFDASINLITNPVNSPSNEDANNSRSDVDNDLPTVLSSTLRPRSRPYRYSYSFAIPIR